MFDPTARPSAVTTTPETARSFDSHRGLVTLLLAAAITLFLAFGIPQTSRPFQGDEVEFIRLGVALFEQGDHQVDRGFIDDVTETGQFQVWNFHPPLYMWALGATFKIFGVSETTARGFGLACGVMSLLLVFAIGRTAWAGSTQRDWHAAFATLLCAVNPFFLQGCLLIDIDGTVYPVLFLSLVYLALQLEDRGERRRLPILMALFALSLAAKMTTVLVFPAVLCGWHILRRERRKALGDAVVVGGIGLALFLAAYWSYASMIGLNFAVLFTHTGRSGADFGPVHLAIRFLAFILPLPLVWGLFAPCNDGQARSLRLSALALIAGGLGMLCAGNVLWPNSRLWVTWYHDLTSYYLITVPFLTPALIGLFYGAIAWSARRWIMRRFESIDLMIWLAAAVLVAYVGVMTRGATFSLYQAPVIPLLTIAVSHMIGEITGDRVCSRQNAVILAAIVLLTFAYGLVVLGDAYFLAKYRLFEVENRELFGDVVRWWAGQHVGDSRCLWALKDYLGSLPDLLRSGTRWHCSRC